MQIQKFQMVVTVEERVMLEQVAKAHRHSSSSFVRDLIYREYERLQRENKRAGLSHLSSASNADGAETR